MSDLIQMLTQPLVQSWRARQGFAGAIPLREQLVKAFSQEGEHRADSSAGSGRDGQLEDSIGDWVSAFPVPEARPGEDICA